MPLRKKKKIRTAVAKVRMSGFGSIGRGTEAFFIWGGGCGCGGFDVGSVDVSSESCGVPRLLLFAVVQFVGRVVQPGYIINVMYQV